MDFAPLPRQSDRPEWIPAGLLYGYLIQAPVDMEAALQDLPPRPEIEELREWADELRPINAQAVAFFEPQSFDERQKVSCVSGRTRRRGTTPTREA